MIGFTCISLSEIKRVLTLLALHSASCFDSDSEKSVIIESRQNDLIVHPKSNSFYRSVGLSSLLSFCHSGLKYICISCDRDRKPSLLLCELYIEKVIYTDILLSNKDSVMLMLSP